MAKKGHKASTSKIPIKADEQHYYFTPLFKIEDTGLPLFPSEHLSRDLANLSSSKEFWKLARKPPATSWSFLTAVTTLSLTRLCLGLHNAVRRPRSRVRCRDVRAHRGEFLVSPGCSSSTSWPPWASRFSLSSLVGRLADDITLSGLRFWLKLIFGCSFI